MEKIPYISANPESCYPITYNCCRQKRRLNNLSVLVGEIDSVLKG